MEKAVARWETSRYDDGVRLAELVREARLAQGLSRSQLARLAGVSPPVITRLEGGKRLGRADTIMRITGALGIPAAEVQRILRSEPAEEQGAVQYENIDLSDVPPEDRPALRRAIQALVREFRRRPRAQ